MRKMNDTLRFISKLSLLKLLNAAGLISSFYLSKIFKGIQPWGMPMTLSVEPTTACNLKCPECPSGLRSFTRPTGSLSPGLFSRLVEDQYRHLLYLIFYFQGEPYIHPSFLDMVEQAHQRNIYTITSTNGHFLNETNAERTVRSGLDRLIISLDGTTQEIYQQYRKEGKIDNVIQGARNVVKWKKKLKSSTPHIIFQFLVVRPNEHQIDEAKRLAEVIGVNEIRYKTAQLYDYEDGHDLMPTQDRYSRYRKDKGGRYQLKSTLRDECWKMWHAAVMTWDGQIVPCCFDKDANHSMGSIGPDHSLQSIWYNDRYKELRSKIKEGRDKIEICTNCTEGCQVWS
jgi:Predicted Fe-S oxidoreductases